MITCSTASTFHFEPRATLDIPGRADSCSLARSLARLAELGLVSRELPFGEPARGGKRSLYRIADPFFRLWFGVVAPHRALLAMATREARRRLLLGEVRWHDQPVSGEALERIHRELSARCRPSVGNGSEEVARRVIVPRAKVSSGARLPFFVFDAGAVVETIG